MSLQPTTTQTRRVRRFGPLFYSALSVAVLVFVGYFGWRTWPTIERHITTQRLLGDLQDANAKTRQLAAEELSEIDADYSSTLIEMLNHENDEIRLFACEQLGGLRPLDVTALSPLTRSLSDTDPMVRCYAAHALARYSTLAPGTSRQQEQSAIGQLCDALSDENADVREAAAYALAGFAKRSPGIATALEAALNDEEPRVRLRAAWSLCEIDHDNLAMMVPVLENVMSGSDTTAHDFAKAIVDALGPVAEDEFPDLVKEVNRGFAQ